MRPAYWIVGGILILTIALVTGWSQPTASEPAVPGQYPLQSIEIWPSTVSMGLYRPQDDMGSDCARSLRAPLDAKGRCGPAQEAGCPLPMEQIH